MPNSPTEPAANLRAMAKILKEMFISLQEEGFNERQAIAIIGQIMAAHFMTGDDND
jgi:hypothetical protein